MTRSRPTILSALGLCHPILFVVAGITERYIGHAGVLEDIVRPMIVGVLLAALLLLALWPIVRGQWAAVVASIVVLLNLEYALPALLLVVVALWWLLVTWLRHKRSSVPPSSTHNVPAHAAGLYSLALLVSLGGTAITAPRPTDDTPTLPNPATTGGPDIFLFLLDGYPRADTLRAEFGFDDSRLQAELESIGFTLAPGAEANYTKTWLTVASVLSGSYVHEHLDLAVAPGGLGQQSRRLHQVINDAPVLDYFRQRGYRIVSIPSQIRTTDVTEEVELRSASGLSTLEASLLSRSLIGRLLPRPTADLLSGDVRSFIEEQVRLTAEEAPPQEAPRLVLTHLLSPHPPFVLGQDADYLHDCFPTCGLWSTTVADTQLSGEEYSERMRAQIAALDAMVIATVQHIVSSNPDAVVIVMSDHGARHQLEDVDEHFRPFFAARTPRVPSLYEGDLSLVNVFRRLLVGYFDEDLPDLQHMAWLSGWTSPLSLEQHP